MILKVPAKIVTFAVVFAGILGNLASDAAFVIIPPLAAMVFLALGRHPLAGLAAGFAGVGSGFTANFFIAGTDALLAGIRFRRLIHTCRWFCCICMNTRRTQALAP